ncbi:GlcG/HbpS family heme-binding protein [Deinococcus navajonensis]|uniref:Heme-binding protein n=1 Tax=Deinococcus navajonensis TaxID=309884 RepID=A0ABV8XK46_9DEIO
MKNIVLSAILLSSAAAAQQAPAPVKLATTPTVQVATLSLDAASKLALQTVANCAEAGYNVSATVVDRSGVTLAVARSENAGPHTIGASYGKAFTSASGRNLTSEMAKGLASNPGLASIPGYLLLAGGVPVRVNNAVVGAIGVGGAPSGMIDEKCATDAIKTVLGL